MERGFGLMYISSEYVMVHNQKTGGVFLKDWMIRYLGATEHRFKHAPLRMLDSKHYSKKKIGCIREPFGWYKSYFTYLTQQHRLRTLDFEQFIYTYTQNPRSLFDFMGKKVRRQYENLYPPKTSLPIGAWTFHYINYFQFNSRKTLAGDGDILHNDLDYLMRTETLQEDMIKVFGEHYREYIECFPRRNVSKLVDIKWTPELKQLVIDRDGQLMEYLGYA